MIRRSTSDKAHWQLISQVEHARIAGEIARVWRPADFEPIGDRDVPLAAVDHHDDGWTAWERTPGVDPASGLPRDFTEMPIAESLDIWRRSIDVAAEIGPLAAIMVSGHFSALLRRSNTWQPTQPPPSPLAVEFLTEQDARRDTWQRQWQALDPARHTPAAAEQAMHWLQFFDALSLWLCCAERTEPKDMTTPGDRPLRLTPGATGTIGLDPWPLTVEGLGLSVAARQIPAANYGSAAELATVPGRTIRLEWMLVPSRELNA